MFKTLYYGKFPVLLHIEILVVMITRFFFKYSFKYVSRLIWNISLASSLLAPTFYLKLLSLALALEKSLELVSSISSSMKNYRAQKLQLKLQLWKNNLS